MYFVMSFCALPSRSPVQASVMSHALTNVAFFTADLIIFSIKVWVSMLAAFTHLYIDRCADGWMRQWL